MTCRRRGYTRAPHAPPYFLPSTPYATTRPIAFHRSIRPSFERHATQQVTDGFTIDMIRRWFESQTRDTGGYIDDETHEIRCKRRGYGHAPSPTPNFHATFRRFAFH